MPRSVILGWLPKVAPLRMQPNPEIVDLGGRDRDKRTPYYPTLFITDMKSFIAGINNELFFTCCSKDISLNLSNRFFRARSVCWSVGAARSPTSLLRSWSSRSTTPSRQTSGPVASSWWRCCVEVRFWSFKSLFVKNGDRTFCHTLVSNTSFSS